MAEALARLDGPNLEAWTLYRKVITRLAGDLGAGGVVLDRLTREMNQTEFDDLWRRLSMLYHALNPPPTRPNPET